MTSSRGLAGFDRSARLIASGDFERVFRNARYVSADPCFRLLAIPNRLHRPRLGLAVSRRTARRAVQRNRVKRIVRESFRLHQHQLPALDIVVVARRGIESRNNNELFASLTKHWSRLEKQCDVS